MKKIIYILIALIIAFTIFGCSKEMTDEEILARAQEIIEENATPTAEPTPTVVPSDLTFEEVIEAYTAKGIEVDMEEKPYYEMIGAKDGVIFYIENSPVKIYEFESVEALLESGREYAGVKGRFVLSTKCEQAMEIFDSIEE